MLIFVLLHTVIFLNELWYLAALLLKLQKQISEVPINSKELGFTKPGPYIYELLADLNITKETVSKLIDIIKFAVELLQEDKLQKGLDNACRLQSIIDILNIIFRDNGTAHATFYRVSFKLMNVCSWHSQVQILWIFSVNINFCWCHA